MLVHDLASPSAFSPEVYYLGGEPPITGAWECSDENSPLPATSMEGWAHVLKEPVP